MKEKALLNAYQDNLRQLDSLADDAEAQQKLSDLCAEVLFQAEDPETIIENFAAGCRSLFPFNAEMPDPDRINPNDPDEVKIAFLEQQDAELTRRGCYMDAVGTFFVHYKAFVIYNAPFMDVRQRDRMNRAMLTQLPFSPAFS